MVKKVGNSVYAHRSNTKELMNKITLPQCSRLIYVLNTNWENSEKGLDYSEYTIIKYNTETNAVSLIECDDWDYANEPTVGDSYCYNLDMTMKIIKGGSKVYHNKWQFVADDYSGFDIEEAKRRTEEWNSIDGIKELKTRIGNKEFWHELLRENNIEI